jgi:hypothetical protein
MRTGSGGIGKKEIFSIFYFIFLFLEIHRYF